MKRSALRLAVGGILALTVFLGGYFMLLTPALPPPASANVALTAGEVDAGFIGIINYGHWRLICVPANQPKSARDNNCRVNQEVAPPGHPDQVILAANLRLSANHRRAVMLRLPPTAHDGDIIMLRFGGAMLKTPVHGCSQSECVATADLSDDDWNILLAAEGLQAVLPTSMGQRALVDISADGLGQAVSAMKRAQSAN
jgi:invasion protein IalB